MCLLMSPTRLNVTKFRKLSPWLHDNQSTAAKPPEKVKQLSQTTQGSTLCDNKFIMYCVYIFIRTINASRAPKVSITGIIDGLIRGEDITVTTSKVNHQCVDWFCIANTKSLLTLAYTTNFYRLLPYSSISTVPPHKIYTNTLKN